MLHSSSGCGIILFSYHKAKSIYIFYIIPAKDKLALQTGILPGTLFKKNRLLYLL
jgi:hypothetical protein